MTDHSLESLGLVEAIKSIKSIREDLLGARADGDNTDNRFLVELVAVAPRQADRGTS